jgi:hypothetical protein
MNSELLHMMSPYKRDVSLFYSGVWHKPNVIAFY